MNVFHATQILAEFILTREKLDIPTLLNLYCPFAKGVRDYCLIPSSVVLRSTNGRKYIDFLSVQDLRGLEHWITVLRLLREEGILLTELDDYKIFQYCLQTLPSLPSPLLIPYVSYREYGIRDEIECKMVTVEEYMGLLSLNNMSSFFVHLIQIILFGFPFTFENLLLLFELDPVSYAGSRLFQGRAEYVFGYQGIASVFLPSEMEQQSDEDSSEIIESMMDIPPEFRTEVQYSELTSMLNRTTFIGPNSIFMLLLSRDKMFGFPDQSYTEYLQSKTPYLKIGYPIFQKIVLSIPLENDDPLEITAENFTGSSSGLSSTQFAGIETNVVYRF